MEVSCTTTLYTGVLASGARSRDLNALAHLDPDHTCYNISRDRIWTPFRLSFKGVDIDVPSGPSGTCQSEIHLS